MGDIVIRKATESDAQLVYDMALTLAQEIGDTDNFSCTLDTLKRFGFGASAVFHNMIATHDDQPCGLAMYSPIFSTNLGGPGVYVSDLWVAAEQRKLGLGQRLLAEVADTANHDFVAKFMTLTVYNDNPNAADFYHRLGFTSKERDEPQLLQTVAFQQLRAKAQTNT